MKNPILPGDILVTKDRSIMWLCKINKEYYNEFECIKSNGGHSVGNKSTGNAKLYYSESFKNVFDIIKSTKASKILYGANSE